MLQMGIYYIIPLKKNIQQKLVYVYVKILGQIYSHAYFRVLTLRLFSFLLYALFKLLSNEYCL